MTQMIILLLILIAWPLCMDFLVGLHPGSLGPEQGQQCTFRLGPLFKSSFHQNALKNVGYPPLPGGRPCLRRLGPHRRRRALLSPRPVADLSPAALFLARISGRLTFLEVSWYKCRNFQPNLEVYRNSKGQVI